MSSRFETENHPRFFHEFDLKRGLLGPNLRLKSQLAPEESQSLENSPVPLVTWYPHSSLGPEGIFAVGKIYEDCHEAFGLKRIDNISQIGVIAFLPEEIPDLFLVFAPLEKKEKYRIFQSSTRWIHCFTAAVVLELMLRNNHFEEKDILTGIIGGMLHDAAITPFSDLVSGLNPKGLDEATNLPSYLAGLDTEKKEAFDHKYTPNYPRIYKIVQGKGGYLGTFLKIADRLAYTAYDSVFFVALLREKRKISSKRGENPLEELVDIFEKQPKLFDIFEEVKFDPQSRHAYFEDPQKMAIFLRIRALMFTHVYLNPQRLSVQAAARREVKKLMDRGELGREDLLGMTDRDLRVSLFPDFSFSQSSYFDKIGFVKGKTEKEIEEELKRRRILNEQIVWTDRVAGFDTLTYWLARDPKDGRIKHFSEVCPEETAELEKLNRQTQGVVAYFVK